MHSTQHHYVMAALFGVVAITPVSLDKQHWYSTVFMGKILLSLIILQSPDFLVPALFRLKIFLSTKERVTLTSNLPCIYQKVGVRLCIQKCKLACHGL